MDEREPMTDLYAVLGNPVKHSKSPQIHSAFAQQTGQDISYEKLEVPLDQFAGFIADLHRRGYLGLNITLPFKEQAFEAAESLSDYARYAGAVNTLVRTESGWRGHNTDGIGLVADLIRNLGLRLREKKILVLGAGGAVKGILAPLLEEKPSLIHVANRTAEKAIALAEQFHSLGSIIGTGLDGPFEAPYDLIINGTSASVSGELPAIPDGLLHRGSTAYDMFYADQPTAFLQWAKDQGATITADGIGMLIEQAAESYYLWRNIRPDTKKLGKI